MEKDRFERAGEIFRSHGGVLRTREALRSYRERDCLRVDELVRCASICRVMTVTQRRLEAIR